MRAILLSKFILLCAIANAQVQPETKPLAYKPPMSEYTPDKPSFDLTEQFKHNENGMLRYYLLSGYKEGVKPIQMKLILDTATHTQRVVMVNLSIEEMLTRDKIGKNLVFLDVKDPSKYRYNTSYGSQIEWMRKNAHSFELMMPDQMKNPAVLADTLLHSLFNVKTRQEERVVRALVLKRTSAKDKIKATGGGQLIDNQNGHYANVHLSEFTNALENEGTSPVIDETNYNGLININLGITDWRDLSVIRKALKKYHLELVEEDRNLNVFILSEEK